MLQWLLKNIKEN